MLASSDRGTWVSLGRAGYVCLCRNMMSLCSLGFIPSGGTPPWDGHWCEVNRDTALTMEPQDRSSSLCPFGLTLLPDGPGPGLDKDTVQSKGSQPS